MSEAICVFPSKPHNNLVSLKPRVSQSSEVSVWSKMLVLLLIAWLTLVAVSGKNLQDSADSFYHYNVLKPDPSTTWNSPSHLNSEDVVPVDVVTSRPDFNGEDVVPAVDVVSSRPDSSSGDNEDYSWWFKPLVNSNKEYLYDYVVDDWLSREDSPYYYYSEEKSNKEKTDKGLSSKHRRKYRWSRSLANNHKRESGLNNFNSLPEVRPARKTPQFESNRMKRSNKLHTPTFLTNAEKVHSTSDKQFIPTMLKRDVRLNKTTATAKRTPGHRLSRRNMKRRRRHIIATSATTGHRLSGRNKKRRRRQVKAHQLEYFTDNDGDSQFHAPGKAEGTEWDLVPLEALKDDNEQELGIQYDKKANDASLLISE